MKPIAGHERSDVWRPRDLTQLELRRGVAVARPVPRHWHEEYQFCLVQSGGGELRYRGEKLPTPPASLFMVHPGEVHENLPHDHFGCGYRMLLVDAEMLRRAAAEVRGNACGLPFFPTAVTFNREVIDRYVSMYSALERPASKLERQSLLVHLLAHLITHFAENRPPLPRVGAERQ